MGGIVINTFDWVPEAPRGFVRDLRLRWACEEANIPYTIQTVSLKEKTSEHFAYQPFGQVPFIKDGDIEIFESGACLLHLAKKSEILMPRDTNGEAQTLQWVICALNSIEMVSVPWWFLCVSGNENNGLTEWLESRLNHLENILREKEWLVGERFTIADLLMADVLRVPKIRSFGNRAATEAYVNRITQRPAFKKAYADQMAHFAASDEKNDISLIEI